MDVNFEYNNVKASNDLEEFCSEKLDKIADKYEFIVRAKVFFKLENTPTNETGKISEIQLSVPGSNLFAESSRENFKMSFADAIDKVKRQLEKRKDKMHAHH
jgi:putative sigma-54 modulation protein